MSNQGEQATKGHEVVSLRNEVRELRLQLEQKENEMLTLRSAAEANIQHKEETEKLNLLIDELKNKLELVS